MELQTIFNMVLQHLARQDKAAKNEKGSCAYRNDAGLRCAVGYLISKPVYDDMQVCIESKICYEQAVRRALRMSIGDLSDDAIEVLCKLQSIHDGEYEMVCRWCDTSMSPKETTHACVVGVISDVEHIAQEYNLIVPRAIYDWAKQYGYED